MRLVDADEIRKKAVPHTRGEYGYNANIRKWAVLVGDIDDAPTIEAEVVRHGHWIWKGDDKGWFCSECGSGCLLNCESDWHKSDWCPHCGCKMDLE